MRISHWLAKLSARWGLSRKQISRLNRRGSAPPSNVERLEERLVLSSWSGDIPDGTVFPAGQIQRLAGDIHIPAGSTLTIQPGAIIKFDAFNVDIVVDGKISAQGTAVSPITFTELRDDIGGDTNGDGANTSPSGGNWGSITFTSISTGSVLDHVDVAYGGFGADGEIVVNGGQLTVTNSTIRNSSQAGIRILNSNPTLTNISYLNNAVAAASMDLGSNPAISGVTVTGNAVNGLAVDSGTLVTNGAWNDPDIVYWMTGDVTVPQGMSLAIAAGQVIKRPFFADVFVNGTLTANGTAGSPVIFTELRDDVKSDTNNDGSNSAPFAGNSGTIQFNAGSTGNVMDHTEVRYGGFGAPGAVWANGGPLAFTNGVVRNSSNAGIRIDASNPTISGSSFQSNSSGAMSMDLGSSPVISGNTLTGNGVNGLIVDAGDLVTNGVWNDPDIVYWLTGDVTVPQGKSLTIAAGQVIKRPFFADIFVNGTLTANGTAGSPVIFTELRDDEKGDTNNDGSNSAPFAGNSGTIQFNAGSTGNVLDHTEVRYGGFGAPAAVWANGGPLVFTNGVVRNSSNAGIRIDASNPTITGNSFQNNAAGAMSMDLASNPAVSGNTLTGNGVNGLVLDTGSLVTNGVWNDPDIVYWLTGDVTVPQGKSLTIAAGQIIKRPFFGDLFVNGSLVATGTAGSPIIFSELRDDTAGGDTNNDAANSGPANGNSGGIVFSATSANNLMDHVEVRYGGFGVPGAVVVDGGDLTFTNGAVRNSSNLGIRIQSSDPVITGSTFQSNSGGALGMDLLSDPKIQGNTLTTNGVNGVIVDSGALGVDGVWDDADIAYWLTGDVTVPVGMQLTIGAGQVIKRPFFSDVFVNGTLQANGIYAAPIIFTEQRDDVGGDTNNDGAASGPFAGNSGGIFLNAGSTDNRMDYVEVRYAGFGTPGAVVADNASVEFTNGVIRNSSVNGIVAQHAATVGIVNSVLSANSDSGIRAETGGTVTAINNTIDGNFRGAVADGGHSTIILTNNLVTKNSAGGIHDFNRGITIATFNDVFNPGSSEGNYAGLTDATGKNGNISVDPLYVDRANGDFHLQATSPVIDAATSDGAPVDDRDFSFRVDDLAVANTGVGESPFFDMGAYEFGGRPRAVKHDPHGDTSEFVSQITFTFRSAMNTTSFSPGADVISLTGPNGPITVTGFVWVNAYQLSVKFDEQREAGDYQLVIGPNVLDVNGNALDIDGDGVRGESVQDRYAADWTIMPPRVVRQSPQDYVNPPVDHLDLVFDRPMDQQSFSIADDVVSFVGPIGQVALTGFTWIDERTLRLSFNAQTDFGTYNIVLGPNIADQGGNLLDQSGNGIGAEDPVDRYTGSFTLGDVQIVSGNISQDTTWKGLIIVDDNVTVQQGATLTINPGTIVKFGDSTAITVDSGATLHANGTVALPIRFTSIHDDTVGGDSDHNNDQIAPQAGDWNQIWNNGTATFDHALLLYGSGINSTGLNSGTIHNRGTLTFSNSVVSQAFYDGIGSLNGTASITNSIISGADRGVVASGGNAVITITNSTFDDNRIAVLAHAGGTIVLKNSIVANSLEAGVDSDTGPQSVSNTDVYTTVPNAVNYRGMSNLTGTNANISADPKFRNAATGDYRLNFGSPAIDAANGQQAPSTDQVGSPRYDDPRTVNTGTLTANNAFADMGAFEFIEGAQSDRDLVVTGVGIVPTGNPNIVTVQWTTQNIGAGVATGDWNDGVFLSTDPVWSSDDIPLQQVPHSGDVGPNQSYSSSVNVTLPVALPGNYYVIVRANSDNALFEGTNLSNNAGASSSTVAIDVPALTIGAPLSGQLTATGDLRIYKVVVPAGSDFRVALDGLNGSANELYVKRGELPTRQSFDARSAIANQPDQSTVVSNPAGGTYYILVFGANVPGNQSFTLTATIPGFSINSVSPTGGSNAGQVTISFSGAQFNSNSHPQLIDANNNVIEPTQVFFTDSSQLSATFNLSGHPIGAADVRIVNPGNVTTTLTNAFTITSGQSGHLSANVIVPANVRVGRTFSITVEYENDGDTDLQAPILRLDSSAQTPMSLYPDMSDPRTSFYLIATNPNGPAGVLPPGAKGQITLYGRTSSATVTNFVLGQDGTTGAIDWNAVGIAIRPPGMSDADWIPFFNQLQSQIGSQWSDYRAAIARDATLLPPEAGLNYSLEDVFELEIERAMAAVGRSVQGHIYLNDTQHPLANVTFSLIDENQGIASDDVTTLSDGSFAIPDLDPGTYDVVLLGYALAAPLQVVVGANAVSGVQIIAQVGASIQGSVILDPGGQALGQVTVQAVSDTGELHSTQTADDGSYSLAGLLPGTYTVTGGGAPYSTTTQTGIVVGAGAILHGVNLVVGQGATVSGKITGPGGTPVSGALVTVTTSDQTGVSGLTDAAGNYHLEGIPAGTYELVAQADGFGEGHLQGVVVVAGGSLANQNLSLAAAGNVAGTMTRNGSPVPFLFIQLTQNGNSVAVTQADDAGHFSLDNVLPGTYTWNAAGADYLSTSGSVTVTAGQTTTLNVSLALAGKVTGTVKDSNGSPLSGLAISIFDSADGRLLDNTATDADGAYHLRDQPLGTYVVAVMADSYSTALQQHTVTFSAGSEVVTSNFVLPQAQIISGHTYLTDGTTPEAGAIVRLLSGVNTISQTNTDENGFYAFTVFQPGNYSIFATGGSYPVQNVTVGGSVPMTVNMVQGNRMVNGTITDQLTGQPIPDASIQLSLPGRDDYFDLPAGTTSSDGSFQIPGMAPGNYDVRIVASNSASTYASMNIAANGSTTFNQALPRGAALTGHVTDSSNQPNPNAFVSVYAADNRLLGSAQADANGQYSFPGLNPSGSYFVLINDGTNQLKSFPAVQPGSGGMVLDAQLAPSTSHVQGQVQGGGADTIVLARDAQGRILDQTEASPTGAYEFKSLPAGNVDIQVTSGGHSPTSGGTVDVTPGQVNGPTVTLTTPGAAIGNHSPPTPHQQAMSNADRYINNSPGSLPNLGSPPPDSIPVGCENPRDRLATLHYITQRSLDAIKLGMEGNTSDAAKADWAIVGFKVNDVLGDLISGATGNPGGLIPKASAAGTQLLKELRSFNLAKAGPAATVVQMTNIIRLLSVQLPALLNQLNTAWSRYNDSTSPETTREILTDATQSLPFQIAKLIGDIASLLGTVASQGTALAKLVGSQAFSTFSNALSVVSLAGDLSDLWTEIGNARHGASNRSQAEASARAVFALARAKEEQARAILLDCMQEHAGSPASFAPTRIFTLGSGQSSGVGSRDPNDKIGPAGFGSAGFIQDGTLPYEIEFENDPAQATAPAQEVTITDTLDADVDVDTLQFTGFGFGSHSFSVPAGLSNYQTTIDLRSEGISLLVPVDLQFNPQTRVLTATFQSLDPLTGLPPDDPFAGFLPVDNANHDGEGFITYSVRAKNGLPTGTVVDNQASIVFDVNAAIPTPTTHNTLDVAGPTSAVGSLPSLSSSNFLVNWSGTDDAGGSGIATYDIYVSDNNGEFTLWQAAAATTSATYNGQQGHTYRFYSIAHDNVGHVEAVPETADATTAVEINTAPTVDAGQSFNVQANAANGANVGTVDATDDDVTLPNNTLTFSISSGNGSGAFAINSATGQLTVANATALATLSGQVVQLQITATDGGTPGLTGAQNVSVTVTNPNTAPVLANPGAAPTFVGKLKTPVKIFPTLTVADADGPATLGSIVISLPIGGKKKNLDLLTFPGLSSVGTRTDTVASGRQQITITINQGVTNSAVQTMLQGLTFQTKGAGLKVLGRDVQIRVTDRTGLQSNAVTQQITVRKK